MLGVTGNAHVADCGNVCSSNNFFLFAFATPIQSHTALEYGLFSFFFLIIILYNICIQQRIVIRLSKFWILIRTVSNNTIIHTAAGFPSALYCMMYTCGSDYGGTTREKPKLVAAISFELLIRFWCSKLEVALHDKLHVWW